MVNAVKRAPLRRAGRGEWKCGCGVINETKAGPRCHACRQLKHPGLQSPRGTVPGKPSKTGPLETSAKQAANGANGTAPQAKTWKCASCQGQTPEPLPVCNVCQLPTNPRLDELQKKLAVALEPLDSSIDNWLAMHCDGATDSELLDRMASVLGPKGVCGAGDGWLSWVYVEDEATLHVWPTKSPGDDVAAIDETELLAAVRMLYLIPRMPRNPTLDRLQEKLAPSARRTNGKAPKPAEASAEPTPPNGIESNVPTGYIVVGDKNPRIHFDEAKLQEAAASLKTHGQLQNLVVWQPDRLKSKGQYELIAGERRLRAGKIAGLPTMRCRILQGITEEQATELRGIENLIREDLTPIETARWYQQMLDLTKPDGSKVYTQASLAERLKCSQPTIANRLRMLRLPDDWQQRVIRREISESHAVALVSVCDVDAVLKQLEKDLRDNDVPPLGDWKEWIGHACQDYSRPVEKNAYFYIKVGKEHHSGRVLLTSSDLEKHGEKLDVRDVPNWNGTERRAFNTELWWELQQDRQKKQAARQESKSSGASESKGELSAEEQQRADEEKKRRAESQLRTRLYIYRREWYAAAVAARATSASSPLTQASGMLKMLLWFAATFNTNRGREERLKEHLKSAGEKRPSTHGDAALFRSIIGVKDPVFVCTRTIASWCEELASDELIAIAEFVDVDLARDWKLDRKFLELHTTEQLKALCRQWKLKLEREPKTRGELVDVILEANAPTNGSKARVLPAPKSLLQAKG